jgi:hypothetical protein
MTGLNNTNTVSHEDLLHEALNLVVRARQLDEAILAQECVKRGSYHPDHTNCITPHIWLMDQYDKDLAAWETKARNALQGTGRKL